jgi:hypothetical protein
MYEPTAVHDVTLPHPILARLPRVAPVGKLGGWFGRVQEAPFHDSTNGANDFVAKL